MRLRERMDREQPAVVLEPFGHQVAGQASMLRVDANTVCKPLIAREHFVYCTMPQKLVPFTPKFKGVLHVHLQDEDGLIRLLGYPSESEQPANDGFSAERTSDKYVTVSSDFGSEPTKDRPLSMPGALNRKESTVVVTNGEQDSPVMWDVNQPVSLTQTAGGQGNRDKVQTTCELDVGHSDGTSGVSCVTLNKQHLRPLNPWSLSLHTRLLDKMRKSSPSSSGCPFLLLENVVARFTCPCILDLKVGSRLYGDDASPKKIASQSQKCNTTTSRTLGLRLCGMQVYQVDRGLYKSLDKYFGRTLTETTFMNVLKDFLHNGRCLRSELLLPILSRLSDLLKCLKELHSYRFYASSLLIMYDGLHLQGAEKVDCFQQYCAHDSNNPGGSLESSQRFSSIQPADSDTRARSDVRNGVDGTAFLDPTMAVDVRMIDFAHTTHSGFVSDSIVHEGPDSDYIKGLETLISLFTDIHKETSQS